MWGNFQNKTTTMEILHFQSVQNWWKIFIFKLNINDSANDGFYSANLTLGSLGSIGTSWWKTLKKILWRTSCNLPGDERVARKGFTGVFFRVLIVGNDALLRAGMVEKKALGFFVEFIALRERRVTPREVSMWMHSASLRTRSGMRKKSKNRV